MKIIAFLTLLIALNLSLLSSKSIYVNSNDGNDNNDGKTEKTNLATINKAISIANSGDVIIIEGNNSKNEYSESITIGSELDNLRIIGKNLPVLNGKGKNTPAAISINAETVTVSGMKITGFKNGNLVQSKLKGAAGIYIAEGLKDLVIENNEIEDCNYGIVLHSAEFCSIKNNTITSSVSAGESEELNGGIGILLWSTGKFLQKNIIEGNSIKNSDFAGIMINGTTDKTDTEFTKIIKNKILESKKYALYFHNVVNTVNINDNILSRNNTNLYLSGTNYDLLIENNTFETATSGVEIEANESYLGDLMYMVWQSYLNKYQSPTYAYCKKNNMEVEAINGVRRIANRKLPVTGELNEGPKYDIIQYENK